MKVPMKWLKEYTDIPLSAEDYAQRMVMTGTGVESVEKSGADFSNVVVGRVEKMERHPNSDHLWICQVDAGEPLQIVTGAQNVHEGDYVPVAKEGARLPGGVKIKRGKLRGVESCGMLCSGPELDVPEGLSALRKRGNSDLCRAAHARRGCEAHFRPGRRYCGF